jgi:hypothetical protein
VPVIQRIGLLSACAPNSFSNHKKSEGDEMKGVVFTEFMDMVEQRFSADMLDDIIDDAQPASGGAYTAVGTYPHGEMVALVSALAARSGAPVPDLLRAFGEYLFGRFFQGYPSFFKGQHDAFSFLAGIDDVIHAEVRKLYPDAELPRFEVEHHDERCLRIVYSSGRHFEDLAEGLIVGCIAHFGQPATLRRETVGEGEQRRERFLLERR